MKFSDLIDGKPSTPKMARALRRVYQHPRYRTLRNQLRTQREEERKKVCIKCNMPIFGIIEHTTKGPVHALQGCPIASK